MSAERLDETKTFHPLGIAVLAVSDTRDFDSDTSGALLKQMLERDGHKLVDRAIVKDDKTAITATVNSWAGDSEIDVILTTGGTGFAARDVTPDAIEPLFDKRMDGFAVVFHQYSMTTIGTSTMQSRATAGMIGKTLVFCLPGSRGACRDAWEGVLRHQLDSRHVPCNFVEVLPRFAGKH